MVLGGINMSLSLYNIYTYIYIYLRNPPVQKDRWCFEIQLIIAVGSGKRRFKKLLTFHPFFLLRRHRSGHLVAQIFHAITSDHISPFWF